MTSEQKHDLQEKSFESNFSKEPAELSDTQRATVVEFLSFFQRLSAPQQEMALAEMGITHLGRRRQRGGRSFLFFPTVPRSFRQILVELHMFFDQLWQIKSGVLEERIATTSRINEIVKDLTHVYDDDGVRALPPLAQAICTPLHDTTNRLYALYTEAGYLAAGRATRERYYPDYNYNAEATLEEIIAEHEALRKRRRTMNGANALPNNSNQKTAQKNTDVSASESESNVVEEPVKATKKATAKKPGEIPSSENAPDDTLNSKDNEVAV